MKKHRSPEDRLIEALFDPQHRCASCGQILMVEFNHCPDCGQKNALFDEREFERGHRRSLADMLARCAQGEHTRIANPDPAVDRPFAYCDVCGTQLAN